MSPKLLLVKSITLLYRESLLPDPKEISSDLVRTIVSTIKVKDIDLGLNDENDIISNLITTTLDLCDKPHDEINDNIDLLQRLRLDCSSDEVLFQTFKDAIDVDFSEASLKRTTVQIRRQLREFFKEQEAIAIISKAGADIRFNRDKIKNFKEYILEHIQSLEPFTSTSSGKDPAIVSEVDFGDMDSMNEVFKEIKTMEDGTGIMKTGWQALNRMLRGGFRRGEEVVISALQHNFKTGFTLSLFKQIALYNVPHMIDKNKKPLLLRISFEDSLTLNMQFLYTSLKENETGEKVTNIEELDEAEMSRYVHEKLSANGYHIKLLRVDPSLWGYMDICNKILELEADGYEIHVLMLDYLSMIQTTGCTQGPAGTDLRDLFRRIRNFCAPLKLGQ